MFSPVRFHERVADDTKTDQTAEFDGNALVKSLFFHSDVRTMKEDVPVRY